MSYSDEDRRRFEEEDRRLAEDIRRQSQTNSSSAEPSTRQQDSRSYQQVAAATEKSDQERGLITQIGEALQYAADPQGLTADVVNAAAAGINQITPDSVGLKDVTQALDDNILGSEEMSELQGEMDSDRLERREYPDGVSTAQKIADSALNITQGAAEGMEAAIATPVTVAARIANQDSSSWSEPPAIVKDTLEGELAFELSRLITTGVLASPIGGAQTVVGSRVVESGAETLNQRSAEDLVFGKQQAILIGRTAEHLGLVEDGRGLTERLIKGEDIDAQVMVGIAGFLQNYTLNTAADVLLRKLGKTLGKVFPSKQVDEVAEKLGKSTEDVQKSLDDVETPKYDKDYEPHESQTIHDQVPVSKPSPGKEVINDEALAKEALNRQGIASDGMDAASRSYFTNYRVFSDNASYRKALEEATDTIKRLIDTPADRDRVLFGAQRWVRQFMDEVDSSIDIDRALVTFPAEMTTYLNPEKRTIDFLTNQAISEDTYLREFAQVTEEGFAAATLIGEELGVRLSQAARQATNLDTAGVDFGKAVENFLELQEKSELFLIPLRRAKRRWSVEGLLQQRDQVKRLKDADIKTLNPTKEAAYDAPSREFSTDFSTDGSSATSTARELWEKYKAGDINAGNTLKTYLGTIAYADPKTATAQLTNLTSVLKDQLKKGNTDATKNLYYSYMLTRLNPQTASLSSNIVGLLRTPIGTVLSGDRAFGFGQFVGGVSVFSESLQNAAQAFKTGIGLNSGSKVDIDAANYKLKDLQLDELWQGRRQELVKQGKSFISPEMVTTWLSYTRQKIANKPIMSVAARALLAQDEFAKTAYAAQIATGRAWKEAADSGFKRGTPEFKKLVQDHMREVFRDGVATGKIIDYEVLDGAKNLTFQTDIPLDGNIVDKAFLALSQAGGNSAFWTWVSPFTRVTYNTLEQGGVMMAGSLGPAGKWLLSRIPRYKSIMAGEMGEVAQLQLKSNMAFAQHWMFAAGALGTMGFATGNVPPPGMPKQSFIIPMPGSKTGYVAIPYGKIEPIATPTSIIIDLVQGLRDEVITQGDYNRFMSEMMLSLGVATLDKSFTTSLTNSAALFDVKNFSEGTINQFVSAGSVVGASTVPVGAYGGIARMVTDWVNPYQTVNRVNDNAMEQFWLSFRQRIIGGVGNPVKYDMLSPVGEPAQPLMKVAQVGNKDNNYWQSTFATFLDELLVPGRTADAPKNDSVRKNLDSVGYTKDLLTKNLRTFSSIPLSANEQSLLSKDIHEVGKLRERLELYFKSNEFISKKNKISAFRSDTSTRSTSDGTRSADYRRQIHNDINAIFATAKELAATQGQLSKEPEFTLKYLSNKSNVPIDVMRQRLSGREQSINNLILPSR